MTRWNGILYLAGADVQRALPMKDAIGAVREAFLALSSESASVIVPQRGQVKLQERGIGLLMPCVDHGLGHFSVKLVNVMPGNPRRNMALIQSLIILMDAANGATVAILDGSSLTALRTGAASGVATEALARPESDTVAIFGAGAQGRRQLEAVCAVRPIRRATVVDAKPELARQFAEEMQAKLGIDVRAETESGAALAGAAIVCTATTSSVPVFENEELGAGTHINAVGVFQKDRAEIPPGTVARARIVVDQEAAAREEAGDLLQPIAAGLIPQSALTTELGQVLGGDRPGRESPREITLFKSVGVAVQDLYAAARAVENARAMGLGQRLSS